MDCYTTDLLEDNRETPYKGNLYCTLYINTVWTDAHVNRYIPHDAISDVWSLKV